ncbi:MAG: UDP-N-acetylglucosamine 2-epimerase (non-hydrolyzing) [Elusimicrobiota bacterium]|jgi:UDP-N-acetylglucosamine 2-epimerase (non-hydrolysing)
MSAPLKVICVFGTRPEAIKMAPVVQALRKCPDDFKTIVAVTAQHRSMLDQVLDLFHIASDYDLNVMQQNQSLDYIVTEVIAQLGPILDKEKPDLILVHGDTVTTFAAALTAFYHKIPTGHVEAGLRSYDMENPFPEESSRVLADHLCALHFAPTHRAKENLLRENICPEGLFVTGNTVTDALSIAIQEPHQWTDPTLKNLFATGKKAADSSTSRLILVTAHRRENHGQPLENVFRALRRVVDHHPDVSIIYPVHLNPNVQKPAREILGGHNRIHLIPPVDYLDLVNLMKASTLVVTDSGGIQEEAPALGKPVLVLRKVTERPEAAEAGTAKVIGVDESDVFRDVSGLLSDPRAYARMANAVNPYGDGQASPRILEAIRFYFKKGAERPAEFLGDRKPRG